MVGLVQRVVFLLVFLEPISQPSKRLMSHDGESASRSSSLTSIGFQSAVNDSAPLSSHIGIVAIVGKLCRIMGYAYVSSVSALSREYLKGLIDEVADFNFAAMFAGFDL